MVKREQIAAAVLAGALTFIGLVLFRLLGVSTQNAILEPLRLQALLLSGTTTVLLSTLVSKAVWLITPFVPLVLALAILAIYGLIVGDERRTGAAAVAVGSLGGLAVLGVSFASVSLVVGMIIAAALVPGIAADAYKRNTKWRNYRSVSHAVGRGFVVVSVLISAGAFLTVITDMPAYTQLYLSEAQQSVETVVIGQLTDEQLVDRMPANVREKYDELPPEKQRDFLQQYRDLFENGTTLPPDSSAAVGQLISAYLYATPLIVFGVLELVRSLFFVHLAGLLAVPVMRRRERLGLPTIR